MTDGECAARAWRDTVHLAQKYTLTVYDAAYLEMAMRLGCGLATLDKALRAAAKQAGLAVLA
ncbi:MAG TPA: hypothetical protein DCL54_06010 [Alphaproteobacteria bacterium]|nr:hypothetical protein [Alphaproteobacteria bacterium]HAJ46118.1 hypothetical protein [Alphaproteobacteria bacterium]